MVRNRLLITWILIGIFYLVASTFAGEALPPLQRVLVPVFPYELSGAYGSLWKSELLISNAAVHPVIVAAGNPFCLLSSGCGGELFLTVPSGTTVVTSGRVLEGNLAQLWVVEEAFADQISFLLRIWDASRSHEHWGVAIPVVRPADYRQGPIELNGAPTDLDFRVTLRVYELHPTNEEYVRVLLTPLVGEHDDGESVPIEMLLPLRHGTGPEIDPEWPDHPAVGEIADIVGRYPELLRSRRFGVRVEPLTPGLEYWCFLTVTHNSTQNVTLITPN